MTGGFAAPPLTTSRPSQGGFGLRPPGSSKTRYLAPLPHPIDEAQCMVNLSTEPSDGCPGRPSEAGTVVLACSHYLI